MLSAARALAGIGSALAVVGAAGVVPGDDAGTGPLGPGPVTVELGIEHSAFDRDVVQVRAGTTVRFVVANDDPIRHELIVGPPEVHRRHAAGTEASHPPRPGEVSVDPLEVAETTYPFDDPGEVVFACHLPGHVAYGMTGVIEVLPPE